MNLKTRIIDESLKLISLKGYFSTSLHDILQASGASKGGFYNHFSSKDDLFYQVLEKARKIWREKNLSGLDQVETSVGKIEHLLNNYKDHYLKDSNNFPGGCIFITLSVELNDQSPVLFSEINKGFVGLKKMIRRFLKQGIMDKSIKNNIEVDMAVEVLFNGMLGASVCFGANKSAVDLDKAIGALQDFLSSLKTVELHLYEQ